MPWLRCATGAVWLDLLSTRSRAYGPAPVERLVDVAALEWWLDTEALLPQLPPTDQDLADTRALREALRAFGLAALRGDPVPSADLVVLNGQLAADRPLTWPIRPPATTREALGRVARQAVETVETAAGDLRQCADAECGLLFLDAGGRRRWCAAEVCGVRNRVRSHRERTRAQR
jgi:predicted RNA-binding Zn ribbon-like protein